MSGLAQSVILTRTCVVGAPSATTQSRGRGGLDLLGDLGGDPFAGSTSNNAARKEFNRMSFSHALKNIFAAFYIPVVRLISAPSGGGFADFANFGGGVAPPPQQNTAFPQSQSGKKGKIFQIPGH